MFPFPCLPAGKQQNLLQPERRRNSVCTVPAVFLQGKKSFSPAFSRGIISVFSGFADERAVYFYPKSDYNSNPEKRCSSEF
jgi:hypothetical protein